jgi:adenylate kinase
MAWPFGGDKKAVFLICGVPAAGKTTVCDIAKEKERWSVLNFADEMVKFRTQEYPDFSRADLHRLALEERKALQGSALHEIKKQINRGHPTLIQSHIVVEYNKTFVPGLILDETLANLHVRGVFVIEAPASDIVGRRERSAKYADYSKDTEFVAQHMRYTDIAALSLAFKACCPFAKIKNPAVSASGGVHPAASELVDRVNSLLSELNLKGTA